MNKFIPKTRQPGSHVFPNGGSTTNATTNAGITPGGIAPKPKARPPANPSTHPPMHNLARVKNTGTGPQLGVTNAPTGPQPSGLQKGQAPQLGATASQKPKKRTHPFFGSNALGY